MSKSLKNINIYSFYNKYWNIRKKYDESLCNDQNHSLSLEKTNREKHQCATYNYASKKLDDKYFDSWCKARNCGKIGFLTAIIVKKTLEYYKINNPIIEENLINFLGLIESKFVSFGLNYYKWKICFRKSNLNFNILTLGDEVYLNRVIYLKQMKITESDFEVLCLFLNKYLLK